MDPALLVGGTSHKTYGQLKPSGVEMHIPLPRYDLFNDCYGQAVVTSDSVTTTSWTWSDSTTTLVIEGHTRIQLCVSSYNQDVQVEKEYHILNMVSPYIGPQGQV